MAGALPKELLKLGTEVRVMLPKYGAISEELLKGLNTVKNIEVKVGWRSKYCGIQELIHEGVHYYFIDNEYYFKRSSLYGEVDDGERFAFFSKAVLEVCRALNYQPDIIHCHDWHTAMVPYLLKESYSSEPFYQDMKTVFTIHNLQFQGVFPYSVLGELLNLDDSHFTYEKLEYHDNVNFMKGALSSADAITTVSPTYRNEIQTPYYGEGLDSLLRHRDDSLRGILNGIDSAIYNPAADSLIEQPYSEDTLHYKRRNKLALQKEFGLPQSEEIPLISMVTRLTKQKGLDLMKRVLHEMLDWDVLFIILGSGDREFEDFFRSMEHAYPQKCKAYIGFDEPLAHRIYAGSDMFLMPSQFEPCGLGQLIALRYGSLPIVRETGGLNDTVDPYNEYTGEGNGFSFTNFNAHDMKYTVQYAVELYSQKETWENIVKSAMSKDCSWSASANEYQRLYAELIPGRDIRVL